MLAEARSFRDDTKGAVMLTGLFMSFVLVGALWYVIGVGDAIIFRDRMQEAADHAVFSSAAVHAKGMNFISVINLIMLILVAVHIVFGLIQDATIAVCLAAGIGCLWCLAACPRIPGAIENFHNVADKVKKGLTILASIETGIAIGTPWIGTAKGYGIGSDYKQGSGNAYLAGGGVNVLAIGPSNIFVNGGKGIMVSKAIPVGLPVTGEKYSFLCFLIGKKAISVLKMIPGLGSISYFDKAMDILGSFAGTALKFRYCNDLGSGDSQFESTKKQLGKAQDELASGKRADEVADQKAKDQAAADKAAGKGDGSYQPVLPGLNGDQSAANKVDISTNGGKRDDTKDVNGWSPWFDPGFDKGWGDSGVLVTLDSASNGAQPSRIWAVAMNPKMMDTSEHKVSIGANTKAKAWRGDSEQLRCNVHSRVMPAPVSCPCRPPVVTICQVSPSPVPMGATQKMSTGRLPRRPESGTISPLFIERLPWRTLVASISARPIPPSAGRGPANPRCCPSRTARRRSRPSYSSTRTTSRCASAVPRWRITWKAMKGA